MGRYGNIEYHFATNSNSLAVSGRCCNGQQQLVRKATARHGHYAETGVGVTQLGRLQLPLLSGLY